MGAKTQEKTIGKHRYQVTQLTAWDSLFMKARLARVFGPAMAKGLGGFKGFVDRDVLEAAQKIGPALEALFLTLTPEEIREITNGLLKTAIVFVKGQNGQTVNRPVLDVFDLHFQGEDLELFGLLRFAFEVNFGPFFAALLGFVSSRQAAVESSSEASESALTSAGQPGASSSSA